MQIGNIDWSKGFTINSYQRARRGADELRVRLPLFIGSVYIYGIFLGDVSSMSLQKLSQEDIREEVVAEIVLESIQRVFWYAGAPALDKKSAIGVF